MSEVRRSFWRRNRWLMWIAGGVLAALAVLAVLADLALRRVEPFLRTQIVAGLHEHFHARVELDSFHVSLVHGLSAQGAGLRIWPPAQVEGVAVPEAAGPDEPLIRLDEFRFHAPLHYKRGVPIRISVVQLKGLTIDVPPKSHFHNASGDTGGTAAAGGKPEAGNSGTAGALGAGGTAGSQASVKSKGLARLLSFAVDSLECTGANLVLETSKPGKLPLEFAIARVKLTNITSGGAMKFDAELTNPRPVGTIYTTGSFGPWVVDDPGESAMNGDYRFEHADLATFKGIAGILNSTGHFQGTLRNIVADGETDTPDFRLPQLGNAMQLHTRFHARIDGTNGDTWLEPVDATLGGSHFTTAGQVVRVAEAVNGALRERGRDIALKINVDRARIEDFLRLATRTPTPLLTGDVKVKAMLHIPPGAATVVERMTLTGDFNLDQVRFTSAKIQDRIEELSLRGQGRAKDMKSTDAAGIRSGMKGTFNMAGGTIKLSSLDYTVPGAEIQLHGDYGVVAGTLSFTGTAKMQASVSRIVGGWKGFLLKPADRYFKKDGAGTEVPIYVRGTREAPQFGIDFDRIKGKSAQKPETEQK